MEKPEITKVANTQMPLGATLGIPMFGDPDEVDATLEGLPGSAPGGRTRAVFDARLLAARLRAQGG